MGMSSNSLASVSTMNPVIQQTQEQQQQPPQMVVALPMSEIVISDQVKAFGLPTGTVLLSDVVLQASDQSSNAVLLCVPQEYVAVEVTTGGANKAWGWYQDTGTVSSALTALQTNNPITVEVGHGILCENQTESTRDSETLAKEWLMDSAIATQALLSLNEGMICEED